MTTDYYAGKTAVITGAASGMGLLTAKTLAAAGGNVVMCDFNEEGVKKAADEINALGKGKAYAVVADVRKFADAERAAALAIEKTGRIDLLVNFAGGNEARCCKSFVPFYEQPVEVIDWGLDVNLKGAVYFSRACMPYMVKAKSGVIVCMGSVTGFEGDGNGTMYGTAKSGLFNFVVGAAKAGAPHGRTASGCSASRRVQSSHARRWERWRPRSAAPLSRRRLWTSCFTSRPTAARPSPARRTSSTPDGFASDAAPPPGSSRRGSDELKGAADGVRRPWHSCAPDGGAVSCAGSRSSMRRA